MLGLYLVIWSGGHNVYKSKPFMLPFMDWLDFVCFEKIIFINVEK